MSSQLNQKTAARPKKNKKKKKKQSSQSAEAMVVIPRHFRKLTTLKNMHTHRNE